jgi:ribosome-binding factor A
MNQRTDRVNELVRQELGRIIAEEIELPPESLVTITKVMTSPDIKSSRVLITILPDRLRGSILEILKKNQHHLHKILTGSLKTKFIPNLLFSIDEQELHAQKIDQILDEINAK